MSRYRIPSDRFDIWVGWDRPMQTFFAQVWPVAESGEREDDPILWVGLEHDEIQSLDVLQDHLRPYVRIPDEVAFNLNVDFATSEPRTALQDLMRRIAQGEP